ncbi:MAG: CHAT domain-containing protein, partial [Rhodomicrobium sp.]
ADNSETGNALNTLGDIQIRLGRPEEAEVTARQVVRIWDKSFGARSNAAANARNTLASTLMAQGKLADALQAAEEAFAIWKSLAPAPGHDDVFGAWRVATIHAAMGNRAAAEPLFQHAYDMWLAILGPTDARTNLALSGLALVHFANSDWARSYEESGKLIAAAAERSGFGTAALGSAISSSFASEIERSRRDIELNIKAAYRLAEAEPARRGELAALTFERAQWALNTKAAAALALMAARTAKGSQAIAKLVSEREALLKNWQEVNTKLYAALSASSSISGTVPKLRAQLGEIEKKKSAIDAALSENFPNYAEVSTVQPASISQLTNASSSQPRALLGGNDALILILPTDEIAPAGAETFIWAVTETKTRWVRSGIGTAELASMVQALRCGLDEDAWIGGGAAQCSQQLNMPVNKAPDVDAPLPFDLARAQALYTALFGELKDIIEGKDLFIVPSGPLSQLPFQVLVTSLSNETSSGWRQRDVGLLGAEMTDLAPNERQALKLPAGRGTKIVKPLPNSAAEAAGLKSGDILLSIGGADAGNIQEAGEAIRAYPAGARVRLWVLRAGAGLNITATLGRKSVSEWVPRLLAETEGRHVAWLIRDHALTVLPAVSSLDALRRVARPSAAAKPMIGFGNPLLEGMPDDPKFGKDDARRAKLARELEHCPVPQLVASNKMAVRGVQALSTAGGLASVKQIRIQVPLPETAYELCAVASDVHADPDAIYLGRNATEREVKRLNATGQLAHYRIVHFATHGAFAGPIGNEPGLILTPPKVASEEDDGYLTASEIAGLKLDADWVILSACNTAAGGAENAEALSGLARAFIYAQARALLVSHWAVKSGATVKLITGAISRLAADKTMGRAEAMRQSMLVLIKTGTEREAHPSYWAPFIVVGEGGAPR